MHLYFNKMLSVLGVIGIAAFFPVNSFFCAFAPSLGCISMYTFHCTSFEAVTSRVALFLLAGLQKPLTSNGLT